jgi:hypothetical protein
MLRTDCREGEGKRCLCLTFEALVFSAEITLRRDGVFSVKGDVAAMRDRGRKREEEEVSPLLEKRFELGRKKLRRRATAFSLLFSFSFVFSVCFSVSGIPDIAVYLLPSTLIHAAQQPWRPSWSSEYLPASVLRFLGLFPPWKPLSVLPVTRNGES